MTWTTTRSVDIVEKDKACEDTAELPKMDESRIEIRLSLRHALKLSARPSRTATFFLAEPREQAATLTRRWR